MANELRLSAVPGLSPTAQLYNGLAAVGAPVSMTEIPGTGAYFGSVPNNTPYGQYTVVAIAGTSVLASGELLWQGHYELIDSMAKTQGLDHANPATTTQTTLDAGNIHVAITGDQINNTTLTADV